MKTIALYTLVAIGGCQTAFAQKSEIFDCIDKNTMEVNASCMAKTIETNSSQHDFFDELAHKSVVSQQDAMATITYYPEQNLIAVKSIEARSEQLLVANR